MYRRTIHRAVLLQITLAVAALHVVAPHIAVAQDAAAPAATEVTWDQVRPVFQKRCFACHRGEQARGSLDLSSVAGIKTGSSSGVAVVAGNPEESMIYTLAAHLENPKMPPNRARIAQRELDLIFGWIQGGLSERVTETSTKTTMTRRPKMTRPRTVISRVRKSDSTTAMKIASASSSDAASVVAAPEVPVKIIPRQSYVVTAMAASPTASLVAISAPQQILIYQWTDQSLVTTVPFPEGDVFSLRFSQDGSMLIAGGGIGAETGKVVGIEVTTGERVFEVGEESDVVLAADISPDGRMVAFGGPTRTVQLFDSVSGLPVAEMKKHTDWILSTAFSNDGLLLATGDRFGSLLVWEAATGKEFAVLRGHTGAINALAWSADSNELISAGDDGTIRFWNMHDCAEVRRINGDVGGILAADFDAAKKMVVGGRGQTLSIHSSPDHRAHSIKMADEVTRLAITQDASHVVVADAIGNIKLFHIETGVEVGEFVLPEIESATR
jgi:WD40 repeat protein